MKRLVLIDGSSYLYRAFHALPPLTNDAGEPTGALFGVVNMLRSTLAERPDYVAFVVDAPGKTFRDDLDPQYKANRPPMPDDLRAQVLPMCEIVEALGIPILRIDGVEADDVIGTLALRAAGDAIDVTISTGDKDFAQLVRPGVVLVNTMSGSRMDSDEAVIAKFGVRPNQIVDLLSLMGDSVDNVPGVEKCGPKTAAKWLAEYDTLEGVIAHADQIKGKIGENLRAVLGRLPLNRQLTTIKTDVELDRGPQQLALRERDTEALRALYARYGFKQALREIEGAAATTANEIAADRAGLRATAAGHARSNAAGETPDAALSAKGEYEAIVTQPQLDALVAALQSSEEFAFDSETDSLDPMMANLVGLSFATEPGRAVYIPLAHDYPGVPAQLDRQAVLDALRPVFADPARRKLGQHGKYDLHVLRRHGVDVLGYADDTMLESFVYNATGSRHDMDSLAKRYLGYDTIKYADVAGKGAKQILFSQVALDDATKYAAEDADVTLRLHRVLGARLAAEPELEKVYREIEMPLVPVLERIEANGVMIDGDELRRQSQDLGKRMLAAQIKATELAGRTFNLDSPKQLQALLFDELKLPVLVKTPTGQPSTNEEALEAIADQHELPRVILEYRGLAKLRSTYTDKLSEMVNPHTGRVHTSYHQAGAATGRLASSDPNLQNIPIRTDDGRRIRRAFVAPEGRRLVACDYSQIELRIMAHLSEDPGLVRAFESGADVHRATAAEVFGKKSLEEVSANERRAAKAINFGLMYGMSAFGLARQLGIGRGEAQDYIALYFSRYPGVRDFMERTRQDARDKGYVETVFGRRLYLENIKASNQGLRAGAERAAINAPMQGTAADIIKRAMIDIDGWLSQHADRAKMILQVHDELVFEVESAFADTLIAQATQRMATAATLRVPLVVDTGIGINWDEAH
ncbi:DNA polymerase I, 3' -- 5' polymerase, 5' -- 3' and 3' -- 5' exonuclease [Lysobacter capsici]|uniref:DNA polymerase I n=1 Tax=Lysobacter capsici TaxID=435897 RepID=UPI0007165046|nr:DNA polymerase I [Lysobacter capsici]ALN88294.1 DNA polymerase I, 3' -- 5' polymerase, 5' -- 3' and 3' -- 5' exonuclease [Lysobacter capsici]